MVKKYFCGVLEAVREGDGLSGKAGKGDQGEHDGEVAGEGSGVDG